jgi:hypothetical protein
MPGTVALAGELKIEVGANQPGYAPLAGQFAPAVETAIEGELAETGTVSRAAVDVGMSGQIALAGALAISTSADSGFPYTFPFVFGGGNPPETDVDMVGSLALVGQAAIEVEVGIPGQVTLVGGIDFDSNVGGFPYQFPITFS